MMRKTPKPRNCGTMTEAAFRSWVIASVRTQSIRWKPRAACIKAVRVGKRNNPETGRLCFFGACAICGEEYRERDLQADHKEPVVNPETGWTNWDDYIARLFIEVDGYQALCPGCHEAKTKHEGKVRTAVRRGEEIPEQETVETVESLMKNAAAAMEKKQ